MGYAENRGRRRSADAERGAVSLIKSSFMGLGFSLACSVILWLIASAIAYANNDPDSVAGGLGLAAIYLAGFAGGFFAVRMNREGAILCGLVCGGLLAILTLFVSVFFPSSYSSNYPLIVSVAMRAAIVLFSGLGAFAGVHRKKNRRHPRRR